jgi:syntaxin 6
VRAVESVGDRWGIPEGEKRARRQFVDRVKREVAALRAKIPQRPAKSGQAGVRYTDNPDAAERGGGNGARGREDAAEDPEEARRWEMEEQQMLVRQQDDTLGFISGTLHNLASQAGLIGTEVAVQSE